MVNFCFKRNTKSEKKFKKIKNKKYIMNPDIITTCGIFKNSTEFISLSNM